MSANNFILIEEVKKPTKTYYRIAMKDMDTSTTLGFSKCFPLLTDAIQEANKIMSQEEVEYGLQIKLGKSIRK